MKCHHPARAFKRLINNLNVKISQNENRSDQQGGKRRRNAKTIYERKAVREYQDKPDDNGIVDKFL